MFVNYFLLIPAGTIANARLFPYTYNNEQKEVLSMKDIKVSHEELSIQQKITHVMDTVKNKWFHSYPYTESNAIEFTAKSPSSLEDSEFFRMHAFYINLLFLSLTESNSLIENKDALEEVAYWDSKGGLCIYLSILLYALLLEDKVTNRHDLRYIQGFTFYQSTNPLWKMLSLETSMLNFHSWLSYKNSVLDFSIGQEQGFIQLGHRSYIIGDIPESITMVGWKESQDIVEKYVKLFADKQGVSKNQWILKHKLNSLKLTIDSVLHISEQNRPE